MSFPKKYHFRNAKVLSRCNTAKKESLQSMLPPPKPINWLPQVSVTMAICHFLGQGVSWFMQLCSPCILTAPASVARTQQHHTTTPLGRGPLQQAHRDISYLNLSQPRLRSNQTLLSYPARLTFVSMISLFYEVLLVVISASMTCLSFMSIGFDQINQRTTNRL